MVVCVRMDLGMSKGKIAAQCGHAVLGSFRLAQRVAPEWVAAWDFRGCAKVTLKAEGEQQLFDLFSAARAAGLPCVVIEDAGRTEIAPGTRTVLGIGPAPVHVINSVTGKLGLLS
jgi:PTH2 family peptidyl-tRNA hydrolase